MLDDAAYASPHDELNDRDVPVCGLGAEADHDEIAEPDVGVGHSGIGSSASHSSASMNASAAAPAEACCIRL